MSQNVHDMFQRIARKYDAANDILSLGVHRLWRRRAVRTSGVRRGDRVLDVCTGTGDLAFAFSNEVGSEGSVTGLDFVDEMLNIAREKEKQRQNKVTFVQGDAQKLPFPDSSFDLVTVAFGIRNVDSPVDALKEFRRVLRPRGTVLVLEFGQPTLPVFRSLFRFYSKHLMPLIGSIVSGDRKAYEYLPETSARFPCGESFVTLLAQAGFWACRSRQLTGGIAYLYTATAK